MNTYAKGRRIERKAMDWYEKHGFKCHQAKITRHGSNDFFGCFDFVAIHKTRPTAWVQVKSNRCSKKERERIANFARENISKFCNSVVIMVWVDRKNWRFYLLSAQSVFYEPQQTIFQRE